jgi:hypothetical protein
MQVQVLPLLPNFNEGCEMITAISYTSESSDHYLSLYTKGDTIKDIVKAEKVSHGDEFGYLYIQNIKSTGLSTVELRDALGEAIDAANE